MHNVLLKLLPKILFIELGIPVSSVLNIVYTADDILLSETNLYVRYSNNRYKVMSNSGGATINISEKVNISRAVKLG